jgi:hypothetical protein
LWSCRQLTGAVFIHLKGIKRLNINKNWLIFTRWDFLKGVECLNMYGNPKYNVNQAKALGYPVLRDASSFWGVVFESPEREDLTLDDEVGEEE